VRAHTHTHNTAEAAQDRHTHKTAEAGVQGLEEAVEGLISGVIAEAHNELVNNNKRLEAVVEEVVVGAVTDAAAELAMHSTSDTSYHVSYYDTAQIHTASKVREVTHAGFETQSLFLTGTCKRHIEPTSHLGKVPSRGIATVAQQASAVRESDTNPHDHASSNTPQHLPTTTGVFSPAVEEEEEEEEGEDETGKRAACVEKDPEPKEPEATADDTKSRLPCHQPTGVCVCVGVGVGAGVYMCICVYVYMYVYTYDCVHSTS